MIQLAQAVSTSDEVRYITIYDDALDHAACDVPNYMKTLDLAHLKIKPGATPTVFILRPCSQAEVRRATIPARAYAKDGVASGMDIGGELLRTGLIGAESFRAEGDSHRWAKGCPADDLSIIPASVQEQLAHALWTLSQGPDRDGGLGDEGKSPSPSSSNGAGPSTEPVSSAKPAKRSLKKGGGAAAPKRPSP